MVREKFKRIEKFLKRETEVLVILFFIIIGGILVRIYAPYYLTTLRDELSYFSTALTIKGSYRAAHEEYRTDGTGYFVFFRKASGYPFLLARYFLVAPETLHFAILFSTIIGVLLIPITFFFSKIIFKDNLTSLWSALFVSFLLPFIRHSKTLETNMISTLVFVLSFSFLSLYWKKGNKKYLYLAVLFSIMLSYLRLENLLFFLLFGISNFLISKKRKGMFFLFSFLLVPMVILDIIELYPAVFLGMRTSFTPYGSRSPFEIKKLISNIQDANRIMMFFDPFYLFLLVGLIDSLRRKMVEIKVFGIIFLIFFFLYLSYFQPTRRYYLPLFILPILLIARGISILSNLFKFKPLMNYFFMFLLATSLTSFYFKNILLDFDQLTPKEGFTKSYYEEIYMLEELSKKVNDSCFVVSWTWPFVTSFKMKFIPAINFIENLNASKKLVKDNCVYYYFDAECYFSKYVRKEFLNEEICEKVIESFEVEKIEERIVNFLHNNKSNSVSLTFYKLVS
ncbi:MAG: hypothetical protein J7L39_02610 [Candidatus Aenigmarchaeota archaeon]|nr:hypothetical protein [Candidatus Aenigmarchaeota archaeon]